MTVKQMISILSQYPEDTIVAHQDGECGPSEPIIKAEEKEIVLQTPSKENDYVKMTKSILTRINIYGG